jgi:hypothetical protein
MPEILAAANAIIMLSEFYAMRNIEENDTAVKAGESQLQFLINAHSQAVEEYLDRLVVSPATNITEAFRGDGTEKYYVSQNVIAASSTPVLEYYASAGTYTTMDTPTYPRETIKEKGLIELLDGAVFSCNQRYRVTYLPGWPQASVPTSIKLAVVKIVERSLQNLDAKAPKEGMTSQSFDTSTTSYNLASWTQEILVLLGPHRRFIIA